MPTPQLFDPTLTSPFSQPAYGGNVGPYQNGSDLYWVCDGYDKNTGLQHIAVYKLSAGVFSKLVAGFTNSNQNGNLSVFWPGTGAVIYIGWQGREVSASIGNLHSTTFTMGSDTFGADNDSGIIASCFGLQLVKDGSGKLIFAYDTNRDSAGSALGHREVRFLVYSGSWSTANIISSTSGNSNFMDVVVVDGAGVVWVFWQDATNLKIVLITAGTAGSSSTIIAIPANFQTAFPYSAIYDPHTDKVVWVYSSGTFGTRQINTLISPASAPSFSVVQVANDPGNDNFWNQCGIATDGSGQYSVVTWTDATAPRDAIFTRFTSTNLSTWTSPIDYYDAVADPPSPPPDGTEIYPAWARYLADGSFHATFGTIYTIVGSHSFCGVLVYLAPSAGTQTLELTKIVSGGSASPSDFTLTAIGGSPEVEITGDGHVGPEEVSPGTYELSEVVLSNATWNDDTQTWDSDGTNWDGDYSPSPWDCGDAEMPTPTSVIVPEGGTVACSITNTFIQPSPPPGPPGPGNGEENPVGCFELLRLDVTLMPSRHLPTRGSVR